LTSQPTRLPSAANEHHHS